eukprot:Skav200919  [mRNA]  locus=scaffold2433:145526:149712:+ [translate_table: standard]
MDLMLQMQDAATVTSATSCCGAVAQWRRALRLFGRGAGATRSSNGYSAAISACEKGRQWQEALRLLEEMHLEKVQADVVAYNAAISCCEGHWSQALILLCGLLQDVPGSAVSMQGLGLATGGSLKGVSNGLAEQRTDARNGLAAGHAVPQGLWLEALWLFDAMGKSTVEPNSISFDLAISVGGTQWTG